MTGRVGRILGSGALAAVLAGMVAAASAQSASGGAAHFERFNPHDIATCQSASGLMWGTTSGDESQHYLDNFLAFGQRTPPELSRLYQQRIDLLFKQLSSDELRSLADSCDRALKDDAGPARFTLIRPDITGPDALTRFIAAGQGTGGAAADDRRETDADAAARRLDEECRGIVDAGTAKATRDFRQAQSEIQVWIRAGAFGSAPGQYDIQNGCSAIDSAAGQLNRRQCPAEYAQALANFRAQFYINFNGGSGYACD